MRPAVQYLNEIWPVCKKVWTPLLYITNVKQPRHIEINLRPFLPGIINPWTGEAIKLSEDQDDNSAQDGKSIQVNYQLISS